MSLKPVAISNRSVLEKSNSQTLPSSSRIQQVSLLAVTFLIIFLKSKVVFELLSSELFISSLFPIADSSLNAVEIIITFFSDFMKISERKRK